MNVISVIFGLAGGLALFLFGINLLSEGLQKAAGEKLKDLLEKLTKNRLRGVGVGALVTATIQSSSLTTVTLVGLINAGLMGFSQAVPVIMGANIGTTVTAQIISFKIASLSMPILAIGMALYMLKKKRCSYFGQILLGFGLLFLGMNLMSQGVSPLKESQYFIDMMADFGDIPILGVLMGAAFTALIQSSSAATALVISMGMEGAVSLNTAIALIMGANIGTCITAFLASIGSSLAAKRAALSHILFNVIGVAIFFPFISQFALLAATTASELPRQIANAHSLFNVITVLILLPFSGIMVAAIKMLLRGDEIKVDSGTEFIDERTLDTPSVATDLARRESIRMAKMALKMIRSDQKLLKQYDSKIMVSIGKTEDSIDEIDNLIESYLNKIAEKGLSSRQSNAVSVLLHNISDIERVGDHANNISELIEKAKSDGITFSKQAMRELNDMFSMVMKSYAGAIRVMETSDRKTAERVLELEMQIDQMEKDMESAHLKRLKKGACKPHAGPIYLDIVRNMERISDHAHNIAYAVLMGF